MCMCVWPKFVLIVVLVVQTDLQSGAQYKYEVRKLVSFFLSPNLQSLLFLMIIPILNFYDWKIVCWFADWLLCRVNEALFCFKYTTNPLAFSSSNTKYTHFQLSSLPHTGIIACLMVANNNPINLSQPFVSVFKGEDYVGGGRSLRMKTLFCSKEFPVEKGVEDSEGEAR